LTPEFGRWIAKLPALEDVDQIARRTAERLKALGAIAKACGTRKMAFGRRFRLSQMSLYVVTK